MTSDLGWCERLYAAADKGEATVPWDKTAPHSLLAEWAEAGQLDGTSRRAIVVGCGLGRDSQFLAGKGFEVTAFDISATAIREIRRRLPDSPVTYIEADVLEPPAEWTRAYDLVVESSTVQSLPDAADRARATAAIGGLVAPGGTLLVIAAAAGSLLHDPPPWPLDRKEVEAFAADGLRTVPVEAVPFAQAPERHRWRAEFTR